MHTRPLAGTRAVTRRYQVNHVARERWANDMPLCTIWCPGVFDPTRLVSMDRGASARRSREQIPRVPILAFCPSHLDVSFFLILMQFSGA